MGTTKIKVLHVVGGMNRAGTETMLMNIFRQIDRDKIHFDFISYSNVDAHYDEEIRSLGGRIIKLTKTNSMIQLYRAMKKYGPYDIVHAHTLFHCGLTSIAAFLARINIRISHAHTTLDKSNRFIRKAYMKCMRTLINTFSTNLLACSDGAGSYLFGNHCFENEKYEYFPNVIDHSIFSHVPSKEIQAFKLQHGLGNRIVVGHIGTFKEAKNHRFILEVTKSLIKLDPMIKVLFVGTGELEDPMKDKAKKEGLLGNIEFLGVREDIPAVLQSMDVFILPSIYEGLGLVLLEAQACGIPCVVSEAIQPEADVGLNLIHQLRLKGGPDLWANKILDVANKKVKDLNKINDAFQESGYTLSSCLTRLMNIYQVQTGGENEQDINYFV